MQPSHWWQRWDTPVSPKNPFRSELEALGSFFARSEVSDSTLAASDTPRAKPVNPFQSGSDCTPSRMPERPAAAQKQGKTARPFILRAEAENFTPRAFSTLREKSGNPFRIENDLWSLAESSACVEQTADRKVKKPVKLSEDFNGKQPLKEYLMHFERCSIVNGWNEEEKAMFLTASLRGDSRKLLSGLTDAECWQYGKIVERLQLRFGVEKQAELHQARLLNCCQFEGESLQMLATDIHSMGDLAYQDVGASRENIIKQLNEFVVKQEKPQGTQIGCHRDMPEGDGGVGSVERGDT